MEIEEQEEEVGVALEDPDGEVGVVGGVEGTKGTDEGGLVMVGLTAVEGHEEGMVTGEEEEEEEEEEEVEVRGSA